LHRFIEGKELTVDLGAKFLLEVKKQSSKGSEQRSCRIWYIFKESHWLLGWEQAIRKERKKTY
jgi:hypothetical protein